MNTRKSWMKRLELIFLPVGFFLVFAAPSAVAQFVVSVPPPSGGDDTAVLQAALDNCMANNPAGCTIQLSAGTYQSQQLIAENFHGTVQGMGMDVTTIEVLAPLVVTVSDQDVQNNPPSRTNKWPVLLTFTGGDITVSDLTFKVSAYNPTTPWCYGGAGCGQTWLEAPVGVVGYGSSANLLVERVGFEGDRGQIDAFTNYNNGVLFFGGRGQPLAGRLKLVSSRVKHASCGFEVAIVRDAKVTIGGFEDSQEGDGEDSQEGDGNLFEDSQEGGCILDADHSVFRYSGNTVRLAAFRYAGLFVLQGVFSMPNRPSRFFVHHNTFELTGGNQTGISVIDRKQFTGQGKSADVFISENSIGLAGLGAVPRAGIELVFTVESVVANNQLSGSALYGIAVRGGTGCRLLVNDVADVTARIAQIWLNPLTSGCRVVGNGRPTLVLDQGTGNTLINVTRLP